ncbi:peptidase A2 domain-containing protein [Trichonephila clavipes]|uniref:Peptidase A2 domain-containing protein n=1 Tax=Trichonephila clavipes TaxID=2585209 RepID=A0A8X6R9T4_TRICX|nr:peptidase A2 domain-containing protein [Trichonephila clavipes]
MAGGLRVAVQMSSRTTRIAGEDASKICQNFQLACTVESGAALKDKSGAKREYEEKLRREEREYELEKLRIQAEKNANTMNNPENVQAPKVIHEAFHKFNMKDDISLNLTLFERHAELTFLPKKDWVQKLIGLIPIGIAHLIAREPADKCND